MQCPADMTVCEATSSYIADVLLAEPHYVHTCLLSSGWTKSAGVKGLWVIPVVRVSVVGIKTQHDRSSLGNGIAREIKVIIW